MSEYNGWSNYETWCVKLWMDNEQGSYDWLREQARWCWNQAHPTQVLSRQEKAAYMLAELLKAHHEEATPDLGASVFADLLGAAMSEVNWDEIAKSVTEDEISESEVLNEL